MGSLQDKTQKEIHDQVIENAITVYGIDSSLVRNVVFYVYADLCSLLALTS